MKHKPINLVGSKILIVDDLLTTVDLLRQRLESEGYRIFLANNGQKAIELANRITPDLILLDVEMPGIDGFETCRRLKGGESTQDIPVIFITAYDETQRVIAGFQVGGVDYITKPFEAEEALIRVKTHLESNKLTKVFLETSVELAAANRELQQEIHRRAQAENALRTADEYVSIISRQEAAQWGFELIAESQAMREIIARIRRLHDNDTTSVLITGESGTGKEMIARAIHFLVRHFLAQFATEMRMEEPKLSEKALSTLTAHPFPGNIRELMNIIERALIERSNAPPARMGGND